jgi:hypothetical protein
MVPALSFDRDQGGGAGGGGGGGGGRNRGGGGGGGGGGGFDPAQFRQRMMDNLKEQLKATDDEWKVLEPKVDKVMTAQASARAGGGFARGRGGPGGGGGGGGNFPGNDSPAAQAARDLRTTLENDSAQASEITQKLTALREARAKAKADLETAQKDLKDVLTPRQEAVLVVNGMLE